MPYYQEWFVNEARESIHNGFPYLTIQDQTFVTSFRTRPHFKAISSREVTDISVDPYAYFLTSTDERRYHEALKARNLPAQGASDNGHAFELIRHTLKGGLPTVFRTAGNFTNVVIAFVGSELNSVHNGRWNRIPSFGSDTLGQFGRSAYARVAPTSVVFDAANFLGELRERLPHLGLEVLKNSSRFFRNLGGDYLNVEFGWKPFISDLIRAGKALELATSQLAQQGNRTHRSFGLPPVVNLETTSTMANTSVGLGAGVNFTMGLLPSDFPKPAKVWDHQVPASVGQSVPFATRLAYKRFERKQWFEGEFSSFYPLDFDPTDYISRLNVLVNTKVTPEVLWNLQPWSWLVDWNLRIGDSIRSNQLRANDLLVMHYGYAMEKSVYTTGSSFSNPTNSVTVTYPQNAGMVATTTRLRRIRANPYGFGIGGASALSASQLAILGALLLTKSQN